MSDKFKEYIQSLSPRGIVMLMIESLENPVTKIDMGTFGTVLKVNNRRVCYGCAATNVALRALELAGVGKASKLKFEIGNDSIELGVNAGVDQGFLNRFEWAINDLRQGNIRGYNWLARRNGFTTLKPWGTSLPALRDETYKQHLKFYRDYAMEQSDVRED